MSALARARIYKAYDHLSERHHNLRFWRVEFAKSGARKLYCEEFWAGLSDGMREILAADDAPTAEGLAMMDWDDEPWKHGVYGKVLVPREGEESSVAAVYVGSGTGVQGKCGLRARMASHKSGWRRSWVSFHVSSSCFLSASPSLLTKNLSPLPPHSPSSFPRHQAMNLLLSH